jgi:hypothetical protein
MTLHSTDIGSIQHSSSVFFGEAGWQLNIELNVRYKVIYLVEFDRLYNSYVIGGDATLVAK